MTQVMAAASNMNGRREEMTVMSDVQKTSLFAHRANIDRYRRLLASYLTAKEREFVERRLREEESALMVSARKAAEFEGLDA
jgi:hypothetical protein